MLRVEGIRVSVNGLMVLRGVSLEVPTGKLIALVGRNGAGKTTTLRSIMGLIPLSGGAISLDGDALSGLPAYRRAGLGIGYVPEDRRLIGPLTVQDNILLPAWACGQKSGEKRLATIYRMMPDVAMLAERRASGLSGGQQKWVALARALMSGSKLLLLDEPFEGLSPALGDQLDKTIQGLRREGLSVLVAESDARRVGFADRVYVIERGEILRGASPGQG